MKYFFMKSLHISVLISYYASIVADVEVEVDEGGKTPEIYERGESPLPGVSRS